jgi:hypothetical protein
LTNFQNFFELFTQKIVTKLLKIWVRDPGSEIRDPEKIYSGSRIPDPGVKKAPDPGSGSATLLQHIIDNRERKVGDPVSSCNAKLNYFPVLFKSAENVFLNLNFSFAFSLCFARVGMNFC